jgi:DNA-binding beta-propeller fold protein YncE
MAKRPADRYPSAGDLGRAALAAAGHEDVRVRERVVGVGAAAPDDTPTETASAPALPAARRRRRSRGVLAAGVAGLAAAAVAAVLLAAGGDHPKPTSPAAPKLVPPHEEAAVRVGRRPNSIAVGKGVVFATNYHYKRLTLVDERTGKLRRARPTVGVGGRDIAVGLGAAWVAVSREKALFKLDPANGRKLARVALPGTPQTVTVGKDAVWVGLSTLEPDVPDSLAKVDAGINRVIRTYPMPDGVRTLVATPHGLWIVHRSVSAVSRFDPATEQITRHVEVGESSLGAATYGAGAVWVTIPLEDTVSRIDDATGDKVSSGVGRRPTGIAARGEQIWVTSFIDHTLTRIDAQSSRPVGRPIPVRLNPYALALTGDSVWLTAVGRGEIARIRYRAPARGRAG